MRIKSKFKDYYDFIPCIYGCDQDVVYIRQPIKDKILFDFSNDSNRICAPQSYANNDYKSKIIVICNTIYVVGMYSDLTKNIHEPWQLCDESFWERYIQRKHYPINGSKNAEILTKKSILEGSKTLLEYTRLIRQPVFEVEWDFWERRWYAAENIPILTDYGFPAKISPDKMYQDISYFMSNLINENPDTKPPVEVEDKYKIVGAGFDLKQSFRHRR